MFARRPHRTLASLALGLTLLVSAPARAEPVDDWWGHDKALHFGVSTALSASTYAVSASFFDARYPPLLLGAGLSLTLGAGKELADLAGFGTPSWKDFAWDVIGTTAGLVLAYGLDLLFFGVSERHPALGYPSAPGSARPTGWMTPSAPLVLRF